MFSQVDVCTSAVIFLVFFFLLADPKIGLHILLPILPHAWEVLLEMLAVDGHWELHTIQLFKHIGIALQNLDDFVRTVPIRRPFAVCFIPGS
jgi:hypothetical protein